MYDELAMLEDMVANKNPPSQTSLHTPSRMPTTTKTQQQPTTIDTAFDDSVINSSDEAPSSPNKTTTTTIKTAVSEDIEQSSAHVPTPKTTTTAQRQTSRESSLGLPSNSSMLLCRTPSTSSSHSQESVSIDLSGLDDLLAEVDGHRGGSNTNNTSGNTTVQLREKYQNVLQVIKIVFFFLEQWLTTLSFFTH